MFGFDIQNSSPSSTDKKSHSNKHDTQYLQLWDVCN